MGLFRVSGWFVNHDFKYTGLAELVVERDVAPTEAQAAPLLWPVADAQLEEMYPDGSGDLPWWNDFHSVTVQQQPRLAITGAAGALGRLVARRVAPYSPILVVGDAAHAPDLGLAVRCCDYTDEEASVAALAGVEVLFMVSAGASPGRRAQHRTFIRAAVAAGVRHVVYTSFCGAGPDSTFTLGRDHYDTEQAIRESGLVFTILRENVYLDVLPNLADEAGVIPGAAGEGRVAAVARADVADVAAAVLHDPDDHSGVTYTLTGPEALTVTEFAVRAGAVLGRTLRVANETADAHASRTAMVGVEQWQLDAWMSTYTAIADGSCATVTDDVDAVTGRRARTLEEALSP